MTHRLLADALLLVHFGFLAFVIGGALLAWRRPWVAWLHLPALTWGAYVVLAGEVCPLTPLENALRLAGGGGTYEGSFIEHYLVPLIYPGAVQGASGRDLQVVAGLALVVFNAVAYGLGWRRWRLRKGGKDAAQASTGGPHGGAKPPDNQAPEA